MFLRFFQHKKQDPTKNLALRQVLSVTKPHRFPRWNQWKQLPSLLNKEEKTWMNLSLICVIGSMTFLLGAYVFTHRVEIPTTGGTYTEALVGEPRLINPLYASSNDVDADLVSLLYSGLVRWEPQNGYVPDLAETITINPEQTQFTIRLHERAKFSDGEPLQARDVVFTYTAIQNPVYRSPLLPYFRNVKIEQVDDKTISFILPTASPTFLQHLTVGILPENAWAEIAPQNVPLASLNLQPIGSGPYQFAEFTKDKKGSIRSYTLKRNTHVLGSETKIDRLTFKFYTDQDAAAQALANKNVEGVGFVPFEEYGKMTNNHEVSIFSARIPRSTMLFFHPEHVLLKNKIMRLAITQAIQKKTITDSTLQGKAVVLEGPLLDGMAGFDPNFQGITFDPTASIDALEKAGYEKSVLTPLRKLPTPTPEKTTTKSSKKSKTPEPPPPPIEPKELIFTLTTIDNEEMRAVAENIKSDLEKIGIGIEIKTLPLEQIVPEVIEPQSFELLLMAQFAGVESDPTLLWHSSKSGKGGLNISHYQNKEVDKLLEKGHGALNETDRIAAYRQFQELLVKEVPAVFLYQSTYPFAIAKKIHTESPTLLRIPSDRFWNVKEWYIKTKKALR